jgi:hypothetical protein
MFIFYSIVCLLSTNYMYILVLLDYLKLLKFINILMYDRLTYITYVC